MKIKNTFTVLCFIAGTMLFMAFEVGEGVPEEPNFKTVKIGDQEWMTENLNVDKFRNGDLISEARSRTEWQQAFMDKKPVWSYYGYDPANGKKYGRLYSWYTVTDPRGLAPTGWHIPTDAEWTELINNLGEEDLAGNKLKKDSGWKDSGNGSNESQFSALPGGACADDGYLGSLGYLGVWWSSSEDTSYYYDSTTYAWYRYLYYSKNEVIRYSHSKGNGFSVRCIRD